jgi:hypothetical protein
VVISTYSRSSHIRGEYHYRKGVSVRIRAKILMDLFSHAMQERRKTEAPLAARIRPRALDEAAKDQRSSGRRRDCE